LKYGEIKSNEPHFIASTKTYLDFMSHTFIIITFIVLISSIIIGMIIKILTVAHI